MYSELEPLTAIYSQAGSLHAVLGGYCPSTASFPVQPYCVNTRRNRCQEDLNSFTLCRTGGDHRDAHVLHGWRLSSRTWNPTTSPQMKQLIWLRIIQSGDWCLRLALRTPSGPGAFQKRSKRRWRDWVTFNERCQTLMFFISENITRSFTTVILSSSILRRSLIGL